MKLQHPVSSTLTSTNKTDQSRGGRSFRPSTILSAFALALALSACAVGPDYTKPSLAVPARWGAAGNVQTARPSLAQWWTRLNDPLLNALIVEAAQGNLDVATAKARVREARAAYRQSVGSLYPTLSGTSAATRQRTATGGARGAGSESGSSTASQYRAGFDASWEVDVFGKNERGAEAAGYGIEAAEEQVRLSLLTLIGDVASNYVQARGHQARIALAKRTATAQRETEQLTRTRFDAGAVSAVDLANATGQASNMEATIPTLEVAYAETIHRLSVLTGRAPGDLTERMKRSSPIPRPKLPMPAGVPVDILLFRPDVRQAERLLAQATARIGQAEGARYPTVSLTGNIATSALRVGDLARNSSISWAFGPTLNVPIFNSGQLQATVEVAQAQRDQNFVGYRVSVLKALEEVENALVAITQERIRYRKLAFAVESYRRAATLSRSLYQSGSTDFLMVLDAERSLYSAEDALVQSRVTLSTSYIALNKALGGGWDGVIDVSKPEVVDRAMGPRLALKRP
ncbi:efflux transporter outer membrane subunit [Agrobacterium sp. P15N1-A]|uniref:efflux transporter outer membrane subunit n=1 Tax=Agrobacterium sp. P15N1-A TaxID=3342820 RepID=UPI0037D929FF